MESTLSSIYRSTPTELVPRHCYVPTVKSNVSNLHLPAENKQMALAWDPPSKCISLQKQNSTWWWKTCGSSFFFFTVCSLRKHTRSLEWTLTARARSEYQHNVGCGIMLFPSVTSSSSFWERSPHTPFPPSNLTDLDVLWWASTALTPALQYVCRSLSS